MQEGPQIWRVKIVKNNLEKKYNSETVGSIAAKDYRKAEVFKKFNIDFCCAGNQSLKEASKEAGVTEEQLRTELEQANKITTYASQDYDKWSLGFLADFIKNTHHQYAKETAPIILGLAEKVALAHGIQHTELFELAKTAKGFFEELLVHMVKEEDVLFQNIKTLVAKRVHGDKSFLLGSLETTIKIMYKEHDHAGENLRYLRKITNNYTLPTDARNSYNYRFEKLKEFEDDLFRHIHLENNILFSKSIALQAS